MGSWEFSKESRRRKTSKDKSVLETPYELKKAAQAIKEFLEEENDTPLHIMHSRYRPMRLPRMRYGATMEGGSTDDNWTWPSNQPLLN
jgi:hypothetical protein